MAPSAITASPFGRNRGDFAESREQLYREPCRVCRELWPCYRELWPFEEGLWRSYQELGPF